LMTEADAEDWHLARERADQLAGTTGLARCTGAGRDDEMRRRERAGGARVERVVAPYRDVRAEHAQALDEVVGEGIVVVDEQDSCGHVASRVAVGLPTSVSCQFISDASSHAR